MADEKSLFERLAEFALPELERRLLAAEDDLTQFERRARHHSGELLTAKRERAKQLRSLVDEVRPLVVRDPVRAGHPDPAQITLIAQAMRVALERCGDENLAAATSANMPGCLRIGPIDVRKVLESVSTLEMLWQKGGRRG